MTGSEQKFFVEDKFNSNCKKNYFRLKKGQQQLQE